MAYQLVPTRPEDLDRVIADLKCSKSDHAAMAHERSRGRFPKTWAVDADSGNYLITLPAELRQEHSGSAYCFSFGGALYRVLLESMFGADVTYAPLGGTPVADTQAFRDELTKAFAAHHMFGLEQNDTPVIPAFKD